MRTRDVRRLVTIGMLCLLAAGCAGLSVHRPKLGASPAPDWIQGFGATAQVEAGTRGKWQVIRGELISVGDDTLLALTATGLEAIPHASVNRVVLTMDLDEPGRRNSLYFKPGQWTEMRKYARFPQGLPQDVDRGSLRPKPLPRRGGRAIQERTP